MHENNGAFFWWGGHPGENGTAQLYREVYARMVGEATAFAEAAYAYKRQALARLFSGEYDALSVIKWKDIIQAIENSLNAIEDVSDVVEGILVKNS